MKVMLTCPTAESCPHYLKYVKAEKLSQQRGEVIDNPRIGDKIGYKCMAIDSLRGTHDIRELDFGIPDCTWLEILNNQKRLEEMLKKEVKDGVRGVCRQG
jgi:hypothetical protein